MLVFNEEKRKAEMANAVEGRTITTKERK